MEKKFLVLLAILLSPEAALAAPAQWGIAINHETLACAGYWAGDEYLAYSLPAGWTQYLPDAHDNIDTEYGRCRFRKSAGDAPGEEESCCLALGLTFVSENIGETGFFPSPFLNLLFAGFFVLIAVVLFLLIAWLVWQNKRGRKNKKLH